MAAVTASVKAGVAQTLTLKLSRAALDDLKRRLTESSALASAAGAWQSRPNRKPPIGR